ncbi:uncharacterized protein EpC_26240 [Erwinia pyrifoliae Ep1/96]|nr:uncharacterized protein EpC_26240 [Erwinia pyrifoliae Ep1/96]
MQTLSHLLPEVTKYEHWQRVGTNITKSDLNNLTEIASAITSQLTHQLFNKNLAWRHLYLT